mgnify:CR=1 FL=1
MRRFVRSTGSRGIENRFLSRKVKLLNFEIEMIGNVLVNDSDTSKTCDVMIQFGSGTPAQLSNSVNYEDGATTKVTSISPRYGTIYVVLSMTAYIMLSSNSEVNYE